MKSPLLVILPIVCTDPESDLKAALEHFRLDEDDIESIRSRHWDYWYYPEPWISQPDIALTFSGLDGGLAGNLGLVSRLTVAEEWCGVVTPELVWYDLADHGWSMVGHSCLENEIAEAAWKQQYQDILSRYPHHLAAGVVIHC
jgi:hypothetical protein